MIHDTRKIQGIQHPHINQLPLIYSQMQAPSTTMFFPNPQFFHPHPQQQVAFPRSLLTGSITPFYPQYFNSAPSSFPFFLSSSQQTTTLPKEEETKAEKIILKKPSIKENKALVVENDEEGDDDEGTETDSSSIKIEKPSKTISLDNNHHHPRRRRLSNKSQLRNKVETCSDIGGPLAGEHRLVICFESYGNPGKYLQTFGKSGVVIPDGICGSHTVYSEPWKFEVRHGKNVIRQNGIECVCITWIVTNLDTNITHERTETPHEAMIRMRRGRTISNQIFKAALDHRARELTLTLSEEKNEFRLANLESRIKHLQPKRFSQGPLVFGLQHESVQKIMKNMTTENEPLSSSIKPEKQE